MDKDYITDAAFEKIVIRKVEASHGLKESILYKSMHGWGIFYYLYSFFWLPSSIKVCKAYCSAFKCLARAVMRKAYKLPSLHGESLRSQIF